LTNNRGRESVYTSLGTAIVISAEVFSSHSTGKNQQIRGSIFWANNFWRHTCSVIQNNIKTTLAGGWCSHTQAEMSICSNHFVWTRVISEAYDFHHCISTPVGT